MLQVILFQDYLWVEVPPLASVRWGQSILCASMVRQAGKSMFRAVLAAPKHILRDTGLCSKQAEKPEQRQFSI